MAAKPFPNWWHFWAGLAFAALSVLNMGLRPGGPTWVLWVSLAIGLAMAAISFIKIRGRKNA